MTQENQRNKLKQLFAKRVTTQARVVLDIYQKCHANKWTDYNRITSLIDASEKLDRFAERFDLTRQQRAACKINEILKSIPEHKTPSEEQQNSIEEYIQELNECTLRKSDAKTDTESQTSASPRTFLRTPVYLALNNSEYADRIINQLEFFGFRSISFTTKDDFVLAAQQDKPETIVVDVDFGINEGGQNLSGIDAVNAIQESHETIIPSIFVSERIDDIETRLSASRAGGVEFFYRSVDPGQLIEKIEQYTHSNIQDPYRILVVDDSRAQAKYIDNILLKAGMIPHIITDPMQILLALDL